jgi:hypothetical protein
MSPRVRPHAIVGHGTIAFRTLPFISIATVCALLAATTAAQAQSDGPSAGWQAAPAASAPRDAQFTDAGSQKNNGWRARAPRASESEPLPLRDVDTAAPRARAQQAASSDAVMADSPRATVKRPLVWQPQSAAPARRYPAATRIETVAQPSPRTTASGVVQTAYEFDDSPAGGSRADAEEISRPEPIATPEPSGPRQPTAIRAPAATPKSSPADSGTIYDDPSEIMPGGEVEGDGELLGESCGCCDNCGHCNCLCCCRPFAGKLWVRSEYLVWWSPGYHVPALITTGASTDFATAGRLGQSGTSILFGNTKVSDDTRSGLRIGAGYLLMPCRDISIEGYYTTTGMLTDSFAANSNTFSVLARPFFNVMSNTQGQAAHITAFPQEATGSVSVNIVSEFNSAEALIRRKMTDGDNYHLDFVVGYRYARLAENLDILENQTITGPRMPFPEGTILNITDQFDAINEFNGGQFGFTFSEQYRRWTLDVIAKLALGNTHSQVLVNGATARTGVGGVSNATLTYAGGVLAEPTNIGIYESNGITAIPELGIKLGFFLNRRLKLSAGYNFIYWSKVARPGDQIDTNINGSQIPPGTLQGAGFPQYPAKTTDFWLQGVTAGLEYRF